MSAEDIFRCSIGCEIMLMIKVRIRLIFSRNTCTDNATDVGVSFANVRALESNDYNS